MACCSHCCVGQSLALSGITQLDAGHRQGQSGPDGASGPLHRSRAGSKRLCVVCRKTDESKVHRPRSFIYQTNTALFFSFLFFLSLSRSLHSRSRCQSRPLSQRRLTSVDIPQENTRPVSIVSPTFTLLLSSTTFRKKNSVVTEPPLSAACQVVGIKKKGHLVTFMMKHWGFLKSFHNQYRTF